MYLDGTVLVSHGGTEMGQGLHTKVCQVVANEFGIGIEKVKPCIFCVMLSSSSREQRFKNDISLVRNSAPILRIKSETHSTGHIWELSSQVPWLTKRRSRFFCLEVNPLG